MSLAKMHAQIVKFVITGLIIALTSWLLQQWCFELMKGRSYIDYAFASAIALIPIVCINFFLQRIWVFEQSGFFVRFVLVDIFIIFLVTVMAPACRELVTLIGGAYWGDKTGFIIAAVLASIPSFLIRRNWVFRQDQRNS